MTSRLGTGKSITFFYSVTEAEPTFTLQDNGEDKTRTFGVVSITKGKIGKAANRQSEDTRLEFCEKGIKNLTPLSL